MDEMLIFRKMESLGRCVDRIRSKRGFTHEELLRDFDLQDMREVEGWLGRSGENEDK